MRVRNWDNGFTLKNPDRLFCGIDRWSGEAHLVLGKYFCHWKRVLSQFGRSYVTINGHLDKALWGIEDAYIVMLVSIGD